MNTKSKQKGFTLVELVIVIAVIAILAGVLIPTFSGVVENANKAAAKEEAANAYREYLVDHATEVKEEDNFCYITKNGKYYVHIEGGIVGNANEKTSSHDCSHTRIDQTDEDENNKNVNGTDDPDGEAE